MVAGISGTTEKRSETHRGGLLAFLLERSVNCK
jgi:hypothetical protein